MITEFTDTLLSGSIIPCISGLIDPDAPVNQATEVIRINKGSVSVVFTKLKDVLFLFHITDEKKFTDLLFHNLNLIEIKHPLEIPVQADNGMSVILMDSRLLPLVVAPRVIKELISIIKGKHDIKTYKPRTLLKGYLLYTPHGVFWERDPKKARRIVAKIGRGYHGSVRGITD